MRTRTIGAQASSSSSRTVYRDDDDDDDDDEVVRSPLFCFSFVLFVVNRFLSETFFFAFNLRTPAQKRAPFCEENHHHHRKKSRANNGIARRGTRDAFLRPRSSVSSFASTPFFFEARCLFFFSKMCVLHTKCNVAPKREKISSVSND